MEVAPAPRPRRGPRRRPGERCSAPRRRAPAEGPRWRRGSRPGPSRGRQRRCAPRPRGPTIRGEPHRARPAASLRPFAPRLPRPATEAGPVVLERQPELHSWTASTSRTRPSTARTRTSRPGARDSVALCLPELAVELHLTARRKRAHDDRAPADERLGSDGGTAAARPADEHDRLEDVDRERTEHGDPAPRRGEHGEREDEGGEREHGRSLGPSPGRAGTRLTPRPRMDPPGLAYAVASKSTSSSSAICAASPCRGPSLTTRV